ncbi:efflux transporter periplasmic adaptor subunit [Alcanivorax sp. N3-2A]|nr:efflux transporter periplasmic adaptor subunit [Alcanivorax sp. N3-2A]|tara:strand:+ start:11233 stop:12117 length:885 start_codon:yes stop_codon:yes gene_type:complete
MADTAARRWRPLLLTLLLVVAAALAVSYLWYHYFDQIWTRDARVRAVVINVAPDVSGAITAMRVRDNQYVEQGDTLFSVDPERYRLNLAQAQAQLAHRQQELKLRTDEASRRRNLGAAVSREEREQAVSAQALALTDLHAAQAAVESAQLDMTRAQVASPVAGYVTHLQAHQGDYAHAGEPVMTLVDARSFWVEAYLKETQVHRIEPGAKARVRLLGMKQTLRGEVTGIARGIANSNAIAGGDQGLPSVAPTFEWVRLAQRIPVRIELIDPPENLRLAAGMTASVEIVEPDARR